MANTIVAVVDRKMVDSVVGGIIVQGEVIRCLLAQAKEQGMSLTGPGGSFSQLMKNVIETTENTRLVEYLDREHGGTLNGREHT